MCKHLIVLKLNPVLFNRVSVLININGCVLMAWCCFYVCRIDQVSTLYQNISLTEPRIVPQCERVLLSFIKEIRILNTEMEHLALAVKRYTNSCTYIHTVHTRVATMFSSPYFPRRSLETGWSSNL